MNKSIRKRIESIIQVLETQSEALQEIADEENEKFENLSEGLQASEMGQKIEQSASEIENVKSYIEDQINELQTIIES